MYSDVISPASDEYVYSIVGIKSAQLIFSKYYPLNKRVKFSEYKAPSENGEIQLFASDALGGEYELFNLADALNLTAENFVGEWFDKSTFTDYRYLLGSGGTAGVIRLGVSQEVPLQEQKQDRGFLVG